MQALFTYNTNTSYPILMQAPFPYNTNTYILSYPNAGSFPLQH